LDPRKLKLVIGLALENAIVYNRYTEELVELYNNPKLKDLEELHGRLIEKDDHTSRTIAIWLELAIEQEPVKANPQRLAIELREMEYVLYNIISTTRKAKREVNDWMNYIANASNYIQQDLWIDAKIIVSRAVRESQKEEIEDLKLNPELGRKIDILQKATLSYFNELKEYPLKLEIPKENLGKILKIQEVMLKLLRKYRIKGINEKEKRFARETVHRLSSSLKYMMEDNAKDSVKNIELASKYLESWISNRSEADVNEMKKILKRIQELS